MQKRIDWVIGLQKPSGDILQDSSLHYNKPNIVLWDDIPQSEGVSFTYSPDNDGSTYSDNLGFLNFSLGGGLFDTQKVSVIF